MKTGLAALLFLGFQFLAWSPAQAQLRFQGFELKQGFFHCKIPAWPMQRDVSQDRRQKVYRAFFLGPGASSARPSLGLEYYAPGNTLFATAERFLAHQGVSPSERIWVAGKQSPRWVRAFFRAGVEMEEEYVLLDSGSGFHVLSFSAPKASFRKDRAVFQRVLDSFQTFME